MLIKILKAIKNLETILRNKELYCEIEEKCEGYKIDRGYADPQNNVSDRYILLKHIKGDDYQVYDFGDINKYDLKKCLKYYIVNDKYQQILSHSLYVILHSLNKWIIKTGNEIIIDQDMFRIRKYGK